MLEKKLVEIVYDACLYGFAEFLDLLVVPLVQHRTRSFAMEPADRLVRYFIVRKCVRYHGSSDAGRRDDLVMVDVKINEHRRVAQFERIVCQDTAHSALTSVLSTAN